MMPQFTTTAEYPVRYPHGRREAPRTRAMIPLAWVYGAIVEVAARAARRTVEPRPRDAVIVSVGNLEAGGNGKTPMAIHLLEGLRAGGRRGAFVSRGYGGAAPRLPGVTFVAPRGGEDRVVAGVRTVRRDSRGLARAIGDEGALVAQRLPDIPLWFGSRKRDAIAHALVAGDAPEFLVLDDAFQSHAVERDVDIVMVDASRPLGNGRLLPAGSLREKPRALARADVIVVNGAAGESDVDRVRDAIGRFARPHARWYGARRSVRVAAVDGATFPPERPLCAVSAIARPGGFERSVTDLGYSIVSALRYPDHWDYGGVDLEAMEREVSRTGAAAIVTTEKDWVKLRDAGMAPERVVLASLRIDIVGGDILETLKPRS